MKILLSLVIAFASLQALAKPTMVFPSVFTFPSQVQVQVFNNSNQDVWCTGSLFIRKQSGQTQTEFYSERVYRGMSSNRYFYNRNFNDRFVNTTNTIYCR